MVYIRPYLGCHILIELKVSEPNSNEFKKVKKVSGSFRRSHEAFIACVSCHAKKKDGITILPWQDLIKKIAGWV